MIAATFMKVPIAAGLQPAASCPICLDFLKDPVITDCNHWFCRLCLDQRWEDLQSIFPCPICYHQCRAVNVKKNPQLSCMIDAAEKDHPRRSKRLHKKTKTMCKKHNQGLILFCENDLELLCPQCTTSSNHQNHHLMQIEEAATCHRKKLKSYIEPLRKQAQDAALELHAETLKSYQLQNDVENIKKYLLMDYDHLNQLLCKEKKSLYLNLEKKQQKVLKRKALSSDHITTMKQLLMEVIKKYVQTDVELVIGIDSIYNRCKDLIESAVVSSEKEEESWCLPPQHFGLQMLFDTFKVDLTLDPGNTDPDLIISGDRKSMKCRERKRNSHYEKKSACCYAALSAEGFDAGRHFWQVKIVGGTDRWAVGVYNDSVMGNGITATESENKCWQMEDKIWIGIFLDIELGEIRYYNMKRRSHIHTSTHTFSGKVWPYFSIGSFSIITICEVTTGKR